jgi:hypothetical protein
MVSLEPTEAQSAVNLVQAAGEAMVSLEPAEAQSAVNLVQAAGEERVEMQAQSECAAAAGGVELRRGCLDALRR